MSYEPKLPRRTQAKITAYLEERFKTREPYLRAVEEIRLALLKLAANPRQATCPPGLFEIRPIHRFTIQADGISRGIQVNFVYDQDDKAERTIIITDFMAVAH